MPDPQSRSLVVVVRREPSSSRLLLWDWCTVLFLDVNWGEGVRGVQIGAS